jgi:hypothetical protein
VRTGPLLLGLVGWLLVGCTSGGPPPDEVDVAQVRMQGGPQPTPPAPGDRLEWETAAPDAAPDAVPEAVRDGLTETFGLSFGQEAAGVYPGTRWYASTGSAVEATDITRDAAVLVDRDGRLRGVTCLVAGPIGPDDTMLARCVELVGLPDEARWWVEDESRLVTGQVCRRERAAGSAVVSVTTAGGWEQRTQSVQISGRTG